MPVRPGGPLGARDDRPDAVLEGEPARDVEQRTPADLDVADVVGGLGLDEVHRDPLERLGVLQERDRQVEGAQELGLVGQLCGAPTSAADIPSRSVGASTPRVRARSRAVSTRSEPSRWRWSSAFGIRLEEADGGIGERAGDAGGERPRTSSRVGPAIG